MPDLNLRKVPSELIQALKVEAAETNSTLYQVCVDWLSFTFRRGRNLKAEIADKVKAKATPVAVVVPVEVKVEVPAPKPSAAVLAQTIPGVVVASSPAAKLGACPVCGMELSEWGTVKGGLK